MPDGTFQPTRRHFILASAGTVVAATCGTVLLSCRRSGHLHTGTPDPTLTPEPAPVVVAPAPGFAPPYAEPSVRVRVARLREPRRRPITTRIGSKNQWLRVRSPLVHQYGELMRGPVAVTASTKRGSEVMWIVVGNDGESIQLPGSARLDVHALDDQPGTTLAYDSTAYPGFIRLNPQHDNSASGVDVVNVVGMEEYLPGVLARELYAHWQPSTFEAQAVAARSFALHEVLHFGPSRSFDVTNTQQSQAYIGKTDRSRALDAVVATRGSILTWQSHEGRRVVPGYYSSCCGGRAAAATDVIGPNPINAIPPLHGHSQQCPCREAPRYRWNVAMSTNEFATQIQQWAQQTGRTKLGALSNPRAITVVESCSNGRPRRFNLQCSSGPTVELDATALCDALRFRTKDHDPSEPHRIWSPFLQPQGISGGTVQFQGCGYGHGAGMCQYGAEAQARAGASAHAILAWYYPGAEIHEAWTERA